MFSSIISEIQYKQAQLGFMKAQAALEEAFLNQKASKLAPKKARCVSCGSSDFIRHKEQIICTYCRGAV